MAKEITVRINGDASSLSKALGVAEGKLDGFGSKLGSLAKGAGLALGGLVAGGAALAPMVLEQGAALEALANKSATVFEGSLGDVKAWADGNAASMGLTSAQLTGMAAGFADLLKPMGFTADQAADMSKQTLDLAGALSAWSGGTRSAAEVSDILSAAMLGERDALKGLGISISEADVQAKLAEKGQQDLTGAALEQAKALATQELILAKSTDAQKAWADGSMDAMKAQNAAKASVSTLKESLVTALYPALQAIVPYVTQAAQWLGEHLPGAIETAKAWFNEHLVPVLQWVRDAFSAVVEWVRENWPAISEVIGSVITWIQENIVPIVQGIADVIISLVGAVVQYVVDHWAGISQTIEAVFNVVRWLVENVLLPAINLVIEIVQVAVPVIVAIIEGIATGVSLVVDAVKWAIENVFLPAWDVASTAVSVAWDLISPIVDAIATGVGLAIAAVDWAITNVFKPAFEGVVTIVQGVYDLVSPIIEEIGDLFSGMADIATGAFEGVVDALKAAWNGIANVWNDTVGAISIEVPGWVPGVGGKGFSMPDLPVLHSGGIVPGYAGEDVPIIAQAGEGVFTKDQMAALGRGRGVHIENLNVSDGRSIWSELRLVDALYGAAA